MSATDSPRRKSTAHRRSAKERSTPTDMLIGQRLRSARAFLGLSQKALGAALGVSFHAINKYETGRNSISSARLAAAAQVLQVPLSYFFEANPPGQAPEPGVPTVLSPIEMRVVRYFRGIKPELQDDIFQLMRRMSLGNTKRAE
ncbi:MAG TPA: helix-turn-helix transcriptional regulator [Stellaceae bacterium]|nr:helix-turn-helix transcriptional regulator [Stellaceae bacterium]